MGGGVCRGLNGRSRKTRRPLTGTGSIIGGPRFFFTQTPGRYYYRNTTTTTIAILDSYSTTHNSFNHSSPGQSVNHHYGAAIRGIHPEQLPALPSVPANGNDAPKIHRALPQACAFPPTHPGLVSGTAASARARHGPRELEHRPRAEARPEAARGTAQGQHDCRC